MKKLRYPALVREEAKNLLKHASKEELGNLNFGTFKPQHSRYCIYGQLTGNCFTERAENLIKLCASKVYAVPNPADEGDFLSNEGNFLSKKLVGSPKKRSRFKKDQGGWGWDNNTDFYSPIEVFVYLKKNHESGANERLLSYLKGEIKTL